MAVKGGIKNYKEVIGQVKNLERAAEAFVSQTLEDTRKNAPNWISKGISERYAIKRKDILKTGSVEAKMLGRKALQLKYSGRRLTLARFGMSPKVPKANRGGYTLKATVYRGSPQTVSKVKKLTKAQRAALVKNFTRSGTRNSPQSPWMLQPTGNNKAGGTDYIPFQRRTQPGEFKHVMHTVSLPQMVTQGKDGPLHPEIEDILTDGIAAVMEKNARKYR